MLQYFQRVCIKIIGVYNTAGRVKSRVLQSCEEFQIHMNRTVDFQRNFCYAFEKLIHLKLQISVQCVLILNKNFQKLYKDLQYVKRLVDSYSFNVFRVWVKNPPQHLSQIHLAAQIL